MLLNPSELEQLKLFADQNAQLVVGLSGGVDSIVLLDILHKSIQQEKIYIQLSAIHVHHGLSEQADHWLQFCESFCQQKNIAFQARKVQLSKANRQSLEAVARDARYQVFDALTESNTIVATAQHLNDQAETFLLRLKRGSGPGGLAAMARLAPLPQSDVNQNKSVWRPFLTIKKQQILDYAKLHDLTWVEDDSNQNDAFDRNFLRNQILPLIEQRWPEFQTCVARSAELCQQEQSILASVAADDLALITEAAEAHIINLENLSALDYARQNNVIRYWLAGLNEPMPSQILLKQIIDNLHVESDQQPKIQLQQGELWQYKSRLYYYNCTQIKKLKLTPDDTKLDSAKLNSGMITISLSNGQTLKLDCSDIQIKPDDRAEICFSPALKTKCRPKYRNCSKTIKQCLQELEVPVWQRAHIPYLFINGQLKAAIGYWECE